MWGTAPAHADSDATTSSTHLHGDGLERLDDVLEDCINTFNGDLLPAERVEKLITISSVFATEESLRAFSLSGTRHEQANREERATFQNLPPEPSWFIG